MMYRSEGTIGASVRGFLVGAALGLVLLALPTKALSDDAQIVPQTKLRISVIQWMPTKGVYEQWTALGGEFVVTSTGTIELPVIGSISVGNLDGAGIAAEIAKRLQTKIGLVEKPETTVEIVEYPPIYVVGEVATPGEYRFRPGLTALQALALGGGAFRASEKRSEDEIKLAGELQGIA